MCSRNTRCEQLPEIAAVLGHDQLAHHVMRRLYVHTRVYTVGQLAALTDEQLLAVPQIGPESVAFIRRQLGQQKAPPLP